MVAAEKDYGIVVTHDQFILSVFDELKLRLNAELVARLADTKIVYGAGRPSRRGVCYYERWNVGRAVDLIEISALGEESVVQLVGTTIHEVAHAIAGYTAGHGAVWKAAARTLGLLHAVASSQSYGAESFDSMLWERIERLPPPNDGSPRGLSIPTARPCPAGHGTRNGRSRGKGSGSRLRLWNCSCIPPVNVRIGRAEFRATCKDCGIDFKRKDGA
jgi:hypothetical protein